ncbi:hypothetical protein EG329_004815 [Mollisiaceae sp. DMI_Dod_QoI]|nr:hypothetical protein EG329_004815 [Helotiales sp. DMI_Dod_QoI]
MSQHLRAPLPKSYEEWNREQLRNECVHRNLNPRGIKHHLIRILVNNDIAQRAREPRIVYNQENDPTGDLERAQIQKDFEDKMRDLSAEHAELTYYKMEVKRVEKVIEDRETQAYEAWQAKYSAV